MNTTITNKYIDSAKEHGAASLDGDFEAANRAYDTLILSLKEMRAMPDQGACALTEMLKFSDSFVVCWAATHLLPLREEVAKEALQGLASNDMELAAFNAKMVLREWDAGRLKVD